MTPLHRACARGCVACVEALLAHPRTRVSAQDTHGQTALHWAVYCGYHACVAALVAHTRACAALQDTQGHTPLHAAAVWGRQRTHCMTALIPHSSICTDMEDSRGHTPRSIISALEFDGKEEILALLREKQDALEMGDSTAPCKKDEL